jgi:hypothetical protein
MPQPADYRPEAALSSNHPATTKPTSRTANTTSTMPSAAMVRPDPPRGRPPERGTPQPHPRRLPSSFQAALQLGKLLHPRNGPRVRLFQGRQVTAPLRHQGQSCPGATLAMRLRPDQPDRGDRIRTTVRETTRKAEASLLGKHFHKNADGHRDVRPPPWRYGRAALDREGGCGVPQRVPRQPGTWSRPGRIPYIRLGNGRLRFRPAAIRSWVETQEQQPRPADLA